MSKSTGKSVSLMQIKVEEGIESIKKLLSSARVTNLETKA